NDFGIAVVESVREMRRRATGLAAAEVAVLEHDHAPPFLREVMGGRQPRDASAHDDDVRARVLVERPELLHLGRTHPTRPSLPGVALHTLVPPQWRRRQLAYRFALRLDERADRGLQR